MKVLSPEKKTRVRVEIKIGVFNTRSGLEYDGPQKEQRLNCYYITQLDSFMT